MWITWKTTFGRVLIHRRGGGATRLGGKGGPRVSADDRAWAKSEPGRRGCSRRSARFGLVRDDGELRFRGEKLHGLLRASEAFG